MYFMKYLLSITLSASFLVALPTQKQELEMKAVVKMGERASSLLLKTLKKNMKKSMQEGGVLQTFHFCSDKAYKLTQKVNHMLPKGVRVQRVSRKFRSPANAPKGNETAILDTFEKMKALNIVLPKYLVEKTDLHTYKYYKPLIIDNKMCLKCHGNLKNTDIKLAITKRYPLDKASHYKLGDLRGTIIVTIDKSAK